MQREPDELMTVGSLPPGVHRPPDGMHLHHADATCLVVDKPAGLLSVPGRGPDKQDCAASRVQAACANALVVHRLDMATSGLLLFARTLAAQRALSGAFERGEVSKRYVAVVQGRMAPPEASGSVQDWEGEPGWGLIDLPLMADWPRRPLQKVDRQEGRPSRTLWRLLAHEGDTTRIELAPLTGRTHQLRVHLLALGHPILGDALYGTPEVQARAPRLLLHASRLDIPHPLDGARRAWHSEAPF